MSLLEGTKKKQPSEGKMDNVMNQYKAKRIDNAPAKPQEKNTTSDASKANTKAAKNVLIKSEVKSTINVASEPETKPSNNTSAKQAKNTGKYLKMLKSPAPALMANPVSKNTQLSDTDKKYFRKMGNSLQYIDAVTTFNCLKCTSVFDPSLQIQPHCPDHFVPKPKPPEPIKLKTPLISKDKSANDKELPTGAALLSHTSSMAHIVEIYATFAKNERYCSASKTSCSLCEVTFQDLASLVKHFKTDAHQKATVKGKKAPNQTSVHILSHGSYITAKSDVFYCRLCDIDLPAIVVDAHMKGAAHQINIKVYESLQRHVLSTPDFVQCTLCEVSFDHIHHLVKHFREKNHAKPVEKPKPPETPVNPPLFVFGASKNEIEKSALIPAPVEVQPVQSPEKPVSNPTKPPEKPIVLQKLVNISKNDREHIFRLTKTIFQCNLCNRELPDNETLRTHINELYHKRNSSLYQENKSLIKQLDSIASTFQCILCSFTGDLSEVIKHFEKKQHMVVKGCNEVVSDDEIPEQDPDVYAQSKMQTSH